MGNIIEKITLYDILGYLFPGCVLGFMIVAGINCKYGNVFGEYCEIYGGGMYFAFLMVSYLMGIVVSEISAFFFGKAVRWGKAMISQRKKGDDNKSNEGKANKDSMDALGITAEELGAALCHSGKKSNKNEIVEQIKKDGWESYMQYMYGLVQCNEKYKRIHNYASMEVLCKNLAMALVIGMMIMYYCGFRSTPFAAAVMVSIVVLALRCRRFGKKKKEYTIVWFVNQFCSEENDIYETDNTV